MGADCSQMSCTKRPAHKEPSNNLLPASQLTQTRSRQETFGQTESRRVTTVTRSRNQTVEEYAIANLHKVLSDAYRKDNLAITDHIENGFAVDFPLNYTGWTLCHVAAQTGNVELLKLLIEFKCDLDVQELAEGWTPLMVAAINNMEEIARILVESGADISVNDKSSNTASDLADKYRSKAVSSIISS